MSRSILKAFAPAAALIGALTAVSPAFATDTSFATYTGNNGTFKAVQHGTIVTFSNNSTVVFSFLNTGLASTITGVKANLVFTAAAANSSYTPGKFPDQSDITGSYVFTSTAAYTINGKTFAAGSDLLTVAFDLADIFGKNGGKTASLSADSTLGGIITYSSDFLTFSNVNTRDFGIQLSAIAPSFGGTTKLGSFTGTGVGVFSSDPAPLVVGSPVPEPTTWALMLVGFGAIGLGLRSSSRRNLRAA